MITLAPPASLNELRQRYLTVAEYHALGDAGTLGPADKVELIRGRLVEKPLKNAHHNRTVIRIGRRLSKLLGEEWDIAQEGSVVFSDSEPEPDFVIALAPSDDAPDVKLTSADCPLIIEVADSSLRDDRTVMKELYAEAGIPIYWIVNIPDRQVEVYEGPTPAGEYARQTTYRDGQSVPVVLAGQTVGTLAVSEILPKVEVA